MSSVDWFYQSVRKIVKSVEPVISIKQRYQSISVICNLNNITNQVNQQYQCGSDTSNIRKTVTHITSIITTNE